MDRSFSEDDLLDYVRGTASEGSRAKIDAQLGLDATLRAEVAVMRGLQSLAAAKPTSQSMDELAWHRLKDRLQKEPSQTGTLARGPVNRDGLPLWRAAAVACAVIALGQGAYIMRSVNNEGAALYETATAPTQNHVLAIRFSDDAPMGEVEALLETIDARIAGGPGASGLYRIAFGSEAGLSKGQDILRSSPLVDIVAAE